ncbi:MAG: MarR family winged helix-turn-helix transcriptional regulator [Beutenbergiaceae bacterium]
MSPDDRSANTFQLLTEVAIVNQLANSFLESSLPDGLVASHFAALSHLIRSEDAQTVREVSRALQVPKASFSNTLAVLQRQGLIEVGPHPRDGRSKTIQITGEGRRVFDETVAGLAPILIRVADEVDADALVGAIATLALIRSALDSQRDTA